MHIENRQFHRKYQEVATLEAGVAFTGPEVKSIQAGNIKLENAFIKIFDDGLWLINAEIPIYKYARAYDYDPFRRRKLLLHKKEIQALHTKLNSARGLTIVPMACYNKGRHIKLSIALARGRGDIEKKNVEKKVTIAMNEERDMKEYMKYDE